MRGKIDIPEGEYEGEVIDTRSERKQKIDTIDLGKKIKSLQKKGDRV